MKAPSLISPAHCREGGLVFQGDTFHLEESTGSLVAARSSSALRGILVNAYDVVNGFEEKSAFLSTPVDCQKFDGMCQSSNHIVCYNTKIGIFYCYNKTTMRCVGCFYKRLRAGQSILKICVVSQKQQLGEKELFLLCCTDDCHVQAFAPHDNDDVKDDGSGSPPPSYNISYSYGVTFSPPYRLGSKGLPMVEVVSSSNMLLSAYKETAKHTAAVDVWDFMSSIDRFCGEQLSSDSDQASPARGKMSPSGSPQRVFILEQGIEQAAHGGEATVLAMHPSCSLVAVLWGSTSVAVYDLNCPPPHRPARVLLNIDIVGVRSPALAFHPTEHLLYHVYSHVNKSSLLIKVCLHSLATDATHTMVDHFNFDLGASVAAAGLRDASLCCWCSFLPRSGAMVACVEGGNGSRAVFSAVATAVPGLRPVSLTVSRQAQSSSPSSSSTKDSFCYVSSSSSGLKIASLSVYSIEMGSSSGGGAARADCSLVCSAPASLGGEAGGIFFGLPADDIFRAKGHFQPCKVRSFQNHLTKSGPLIALVGGRLSHYSRNEISMTEDLCIDAVVVVLLRTERPVVCSFLDAEFCLRDSMDDMTYFLAITRSGKQLKLFSILKETCTFTVARVWDLAIWADSMSPIPCKDDVISNFESLKFIFTQTIQKSDQKLCLLKGENSFKFDSKTTPSFQLTRDERVVDVEVCSDLNTHPATFLVALLTSARLVVLSALLEPTFCLHFAKGSALAVGYIHRRDHIFPSGTYEGVTAIKWQAFAKLFFATDRGGVFRVDSEKCRGLDTIQTGKHATEFASFGTRENSTPAIHRVTTVPREQGSSLSQVSLLRFWRQNTQLQFVTLGRAPTNALVVSQRLSLLEEMLADIVGSAHGADWDARSRELEAAIARDEMLFKNFSRSLCFKLYSSPTARTALGKLPIATMFARSQTLPYTFRLGCQLHSMITFEADHSSHRNTCTSDLYQRTVLHQAKDRGGAERLRLLGLDSYLDYFCDGVNVDVSAVMDARRPTFLNFYSPRNSAPLYKSQLTVDNKPFPKQSVTSFCSDTGKPSFRPSSEVKLFASDDNYFVEDFAGLRLQLQRGEGAVDDSPVRLKQNNASDDTAKAGWTKDVGKGKEHERVVGYWRFSDISQTTKSGVDMRHFVDLSKFSNSLVFSDKTKGFTIEETQSQLDCGDDHLKVKHLCDLVYQSPNPTSAAFCEAPRGGALDIGFFHTDPDRGCMTIELTTRFDSSAGARPAKENVLLSRRTDGGRTLWRLHVDDVGRVSFCVCEATALSTSAGAVCVASREDGTGTSWSHIAVVVAFVDETSDEEAVPTVPCTYSVSIFIDGEVAAEGNLRVPSPLPAEGELAASQILLGEGLCVGWRLTELRLWAEARACMDLERLKEQFLPHAAKRKRLQLKLTCGKDFFKPFDEGILSL